MLVDFNASTWNSYDRFSVGKIGKLDVMSHMNFIFVAMKVTILFDWSRVAQRIISEIKCLRTE